MKVRYLSLNQVQVQFGLTSDDVEDLVRTGILPTFTIAKKRRVDRRMLRQLVNDLIEESAACRPREGALEVGCSDAAEAGTGLELEERENDTSQTGRGFTTITTRTAATDVPGPQVELTTQQERVLRLLGQGLSNAEIAQSLSIEVCTVKSHVSRLLMRLNLRNREQLIAFAWRHGLLDRA
jgi:DNA-binding CsgD family transcriptional regulator